MLTTEQAAALSERFQIDPLSVIREYLQVLFLSHLVREPEAVHCHLKGGTALRLLAHSFRFSEDLDFTVTAPALRTLGLLERVTNAVRHEVPEASFRRLNSASTAVTAQLRYMPETFKYPLVIHLQCSLREHPQRPVTSLLETEYPIPYPWVRHLDWPEILAEKVRALLTRGKGRDLFDLWFLLTKKVPIEWPLIQEKMSLYRRKVTPNDLALAMKRMNSHRLLKDLGPFLPKPYRQLPGELKERTLELLGIRRRHP